MNCMVKPLLITKLLFLALLVSACVAPQRAMNHNQPQGVVVKTTTEEPVSGEQVLIPKYADILSHQKPDGKIEQYALLENGQITHLKTISKPVGAVAPTQGNNSSLDQSERMGLLLAYADYDDGEEAGTCYGLRAPNYVTPGILLGVVSCDITFYADDGSLEDETFLAIDVGYVHSFTPKFAGFGAIGYGKYGDSSSRDAETTWSGGALFDINKLTLGLEVHSKYAAMLLAGFKF